MIPLERPRTLVPLLIPCNDLGQLKVQNNPSVWVR